jgi:hypothetical protein
LFQVVRWEERRRKGFTEVKASRLLGFIGWRMIVELLARSWIDIAGRR